VPGLGAQRPETLVKLLKLREQVGRNPPQGSGVFVLGRVLACAWALLEASVSCVGVPVTATWGRGPQLRPMSST